MLFTSKIRDRKEGIVIYSFYTWFSFLTWVWVNIFLEIVSSKTAATHIFQLGVRNWPAGVRVTLKAWELAGIMSIHVIHGSTWLYMAIHGKYCRTWLNIKAINAAVNWKFYYYSARLKQYASMFMWLFFFLTVNLMFLSWNWEKVYSKMIVKSIFRCWKTINLPKNCYWQKTTLQRMSSRHSLHSSRRWQQQHSPLFLTIS